MKAVVVYESVFTNTHAVADAIATGIRATDPTSEVATAQVTEATAELMAGADLLIVGGPTHMRGMSSGMSRRKGAENEVTAAVAHGDAEPALEPDATGPGLRDWFGDLPKVSGTAAAAFDTRAGVRFAGGAAHGIARRLRHHGYRLVAAPEGFVITATTGPPAPGELDRATAWGGALASAGPSGTPAAARSSGVDHASSG